MDPNEPGTRGVRPRRQGRPARGTPAPARRSPDAPTSASRRPHGPHRTARHGRLPPHRQPRRRQRDRALPARRTPRRPAKLTRRRPRRAAPRRPAARPPGPARPELPLLEREEETRAAGTAARPRPLRTPHRPLGIGPHRLLDAVAEDCAGLAPDGVVRLTGYHRTADRPAARALRRRLQRSAAPPRPRPNCSRCVREIGAVVVLDDLEFGGAALDELLDATPECAFLIAATPDVPAPVRRLRTSKRSSSAASAAAPAAWNCWSAPSAAS